MSQPPDIRPHLSFVDAGVRVQVPAVGAVTISDIGMAKFLLAYPSAWDSLGVIDTARLVNASDGHLTPRQAVSIKQLLAAALIREFVEPREGKIVPPDELSGPIFSDAQELVARASGSEDPDRLASMLAAMFDRPWAPTRRVVEAFQQRDAR